MRNISAPPLGELSAKLTEGDKVSSNLTPSVFGINAEATSLMREADRFAENLHVVTDKN